MGMYTTVIHPKGHDVQIKTGDDDLETYEVGDEVNWKVDSHMAGWGTLLDGVYLGCGYPDPDAWVVIKDHKIHAVVDYDPEDEETHEGSLMKRFDVQAPPRELWSEKLWEEKAVRDAEAEERHRKFREELDRKYGPDSSPEKTAALMVQPLMRRVGYNEAAHELLKSLVDAARTSDD